jgi:PAS domain S-box-containing protein
MIAWFSGDFCCFQGALPVQISRPDDQAGALAHDTVFRLLLDTALDALVVMDADGTVVEWNREAETTFGWTREEAIGQALSGLIIPPGLREAHRRGLQRYLETGKATLLNRRVEVTAIHRGGREFPVELAIAPVTRAGALLFAGFLRDISERKQAEAQLARRAFEAELLYRATRLAAESTSLDEALEGCLEIVCRLAGWPIGHALVPDTDNKHLLSRVVWCDDGAVQAALRDATKAIRFVPGVGLPGRIWQSGEPQWIPNIRAEPNFPRAAALSKVGLTGAFGFPIRMRGGTAAVLEFFTREERAPDPGLLLLVRSVGEQVGHLYDRTQSEKMSAMGSLLAGVAHELNNPLSIVVGQAQLLQETAPDERTAARADKIRLAADRCARIVRTFLAMARHRPPEHSAVALNEIITGALQVVGYGVRTAGIDIELALASDLPATWADGDQLQQVVTNLVVNAQQALAEWDGTRRLRIATSFDPAARQLRLEIADSGPGVPPAMRLRVFEPFFTTKSVGMGTGVGLSLCHGIVSSHGGSIAVEDAPGGGARFVVVLPYVQAPTGATAVTAPAPSGTAARNRQPVLVVDDEAEIAETLAEILTDAGYDVEIAADGRAALDRMERREFDLVLSDLRMPGLDGPGLYRALKARRRDWPKRMIFITGDTLGEAAAVFLGKARRPCIGKPFQSEEVRRVVADVLAAATPKGRAGKVASAQKAPAHKA